MISYILVKRVPGDELPIRIEAYESGHNFEPRWSGAGQTVEHALGMIAHFTGESVEDMMRKIYSYEEAEGK